MKFEIDLERTYPHPIEKVWRAITDRDALGTWLMETDFEPEQGRHFQMWCEDGRGGTDRHICQVLEFEPPHRMAWSWVLDGRQADSETRVEFQLTDVSGGTRLMVRHSGDLDRDAIEGFKGGWPIKLGQLETVLRTAGIA